MRTRYAAAALAAALLGSTVTGCSSGGGADAEAAAPAMTTPAAATTTSTPSPAPSYRVYRNSIGGSDDMGIADLLLPGATEATARAAIQDFVQKVSGKSVAYSVQVVLTKVADGHFLCQGQWRKDAQAAATYGGEQGLTISCPKP